MYIILVYYSCETRSSRTTWISSRVRECELAPSRFSIYTSRPRFLLRNDKRMSLLSFSNLSSFDGKLTDLPASCPQSRRWLAQSRQLTLHASPLPLSSSSSTERSEIRRWSPTGGSVSAKSCARSVPPLTLIRSEINERRIWIWSLITRLWTHTSWVDHACKISKYVIQRKQPSYWFRAGSVAGGWPYHHLRLSDKVFSF